MALRSRGYYDAVAPRRSPTSRSTRPPPSTPSTHIPTPKSSPSASPSRPGRSIGGSHLAIQGRPSSFPASNRQARPGAGQAGRRRGHPGRRGQALAELRKDGYALAAVKREVLIDHATREAKVTFVVETGPHRPHGAGPLLRHRQGRHDLPAAPRAVQGGRALRARQGRCAARPADLARRVQRGAHQARDDARRQRRAAVRRRAHRPAAALDRLRHQLRDPARLRGQRLLDASQPVRPGREPAADGRDQPYRPGRRDPGHRLRLPRRFPQARLVAERPGRRATAEVLREVLPAYKRKAVGLSAASIASSRRSGRCRSG